MASLGGKQMFCVKKVVYTNELLCAHLNLRKPNEVLGIFFLKCNTDMHLVTVYIVKGWNGRYRCSLLSK